MFILYIVAFAISFYVLYSFANHDLTYGKLDTSDKLFIALYSALPFINIMTAAIVLPTLIGILKNHKYN